MIEDLQRICELQPAYSSENTPAMQERGNLIRRTVPRGIRQLEPQLSVALGEFGTEFDVDASDGIGRKTEAPWVRFFAKSMAPTPRDGFYVVLHFAANGSAVFVTVGCGSTIWANGELRAVSDEELFKRTEWARGVVSEKFGSLEPFEDKIDLGARAPLPRTFEKATAIANLVPISQLDEDSFRGLLVSAAERLREIYRAQKNGQHLTSAGIAELELEEVSRPGRIAAVGQGFGLNAQERRAVELRAMRLAEDWLVASGYTVKDMSSTSSFDYEAQKDGTIIKVEVKGTTSNMLDAILMTANEVELHRTEKGKTGLIVVSNISLEREPSGNFTASGGKVYAELLWDIDKWELSPLAYRVFKTIAPL